MPKILALDFGVMGHVARSSVVPPGSSQRAKKYSLNGESCCRRGDAKWL